MGGERELSDRLGATHGISRRRALTMLGGVGLGAVVAAACGSDGSSNAADSTARTTTPSTGTGAGSSAGTCALAPEMTEGPFYLDLDLLRSDVTEGKPGTPLDLTLTVLDTRCKPISNAAVDLWHTDAAGEYSGVQGSTGTTFMRGTQISGAGGVVKFHTVYPGWYSGRTVHIHVKVHVANHEVHTGQLFFDDHQTDTAYRVSPYSSRAARDTRNADDSIFADGGASSTLALTQSGSGYASAMNLGVRI